MLLEKNTGGSLSLDGEDLKLKKVSLGKKELKEGEYSLEKEKLRLGRVLPCGLPACFRIISAEALEAGGF